MNPDSKLLLKMTRRVREALVSNPATFAVWLFSNLPASETPSEVVIEGVKVRHFYPFRIRRTVKKDVASFGMTFKEPYPDVFVGAVACFKNARYVITAVKVDAEGLTHATFAKDRSTRAQRKGRPVQQTLVTDAQYDKAIAASKGKP